MLENQCIPGLAEEAKKLRAKVFGIENSKDLAKDTPVKRRFQERATVFEKLVTALEAELK